MKKLLFIAMLALGFSVNAQTTELNLGGNLTYNNNTEVFGIMVEGNYLFEVADKFTAGPMALYQYNFGRTYTEEAFGIEYDVEIPSSSSFGIGGAGRYDLNEQFVLGFDLGFYLTNGSSIYYRPLVGYKLNETTMLQFSIPSSSGSNSLAFGVMFGL